MIGGFADMLKWVTIFGLVTDSGPPPPILIPPGGHYLPELIPIQGLTSASVVLDTDDTTPLAKYFGNTTEVGGVIESTVKLQVTTDGSGDQGILVISNPIEGNFTLLGQAQITGLPSIVLSPGATGNTASGWNGNLTANFSGAGVVFFFETAQINTTYFVDLSWKYEIQA